METKGKVSMKRLVWCSFKMALKELLATSKRGGEKEKLVLDWKEVNNDCPPYFPWMEAGGEEKQMQTQNYLASHCREGERDRLGWNTYTKTTASSGGKMSGHCAPPGERRELTLAMSSGFDGLTLSKLKIIERYPIKTVQSGHQNQGKI